LGLLFIFHVVFCQQALFYEQEYSNGIGAQIAEKVLLVMESVLQEASSSQQVIIRQASQDTEAQSELNMLLGHMESPFVVSNSTGVCVQHVFVYFIMYLGHICEFNMYLD